MPQSSAKSSHTASAPLLASALAYVLCPLFAAGAGYAIWNMIGFVRDNIHMTGAPFFSDVALLVLSVVALAISCVIVGWRYAIHITEQKAAIKASGLQRRARYYEDMLRLITDNIPNVLFVIDRDGRFWFANRDTGRLARSDPAEITGKTVDRVFSARSAALLLERTRKAQSAQAPVIVVDRYDDATGPRYMETHHVPLPDTTDLQKTVLVTQKDITAVIVERERQEQTFKQLIDTLIAVVDRRDPFAAGHSLRVGLIAQAIAQQMHLDEQNVEASHIAGSLMNLGKILVPREVLLKTSSLNGDELKMVRKAILTSADILSLISFQVPVIPTLRQVLERFDGKGVPEGRRGENILITARIVTVANAFVALVSPRSHRAGLSTDEAMVILKKDVNSVFDGRVVDALELYLKENPDMQQNLLKPPAEMRGVMIEQEFIEALI